MGADNSTPSPVRVKLERPASAEPESDSPEIKRQANDASSVVRTSIEFPWRTCQDLEDVQRLKIKEKAVKQAEEVCEKLYSVLEPVIRTAATEKTNEKEVIIMGHDIIKQWLRKYDSIRQKQKDFQILVGVEGPTGAGKSSFLGSLLRVPELFPSGQESAATAVIGKVSWNSDDELGHEYRAEITFRPRDEIESDLDTLLREINHYAALLDDDSMEDDEDPLSRADTKIESKNKIEYELPKVRAVWGIEQRDLENLARRCPEKRSYHDVVQTILDKNRKALQFLDRHTLKVHRNSAKTLSKFIKPFLDSSHVRSPNQDQFAAWPLVEEVRIYVKSDILKSGITLVDLPGCGDATASRSEIAQKFSNQLDVRMVVSPIIRATDEKQGQALMQSGFDEAQLRIRGKLDGNGFGVIMSKIDELKVDSYITGCDELCEDASVLEAENRIEKLKEEKLKCKSDHADLRYKKRKAENAKRKAQRSLESAYRKHDAKLKKNANGSQDQIVKCRKLLDAEVETYVKADQELDQYDRRQVRIEQELLYLQDWLHHQASQTRNRRVMERMRANFASRQRCYDGDTVAQSQSEQDYLLPILPASTKAFWQLEKNDGHYEGFPSKVFTGIPAAEQWLHRATLSKRETHLDETLDGYQSLMAMMRTYSQTSGQDGDFNFTRSEVEDAVDNTHNLFGSRLAKALTVASREIHKLDPLEHRERAMKKFINEARGIVFRFAYKFPEAENSPVRLHANTYLAIIKRGGGKYTSFARERVTYSWNESLASPVLKTIGRDWDSKMNKRLPKIRVPMMQQFSEIWTEYLNQLQKDINTKIPSLGVSFNNMRPILDASQRATENRIRSTLGKLSHRASSVAFDTTAFLTEEMKPTFKAAEEVKGKGSHQRRIDIITSKITQDVKPMCNEMLSRLSAGLAEKKAEVPNELKVIAGQAIQGVKQQLSFLVNNLVENSPLSSENNASKCELQKILRDLVEAWEGAWSEQGECDAHILDNDLSIPETVPEPIYEDDQDEDLEMEEDEDLEMEEDHVDDDDKEDKDYEA
ncbi:hypothetical protein ACHAQK_001178 [Fusarium lateritium]